MNNTSHKHKVGDCFLDEEGKIFMITGIESYPLDRYLGFVVRPYVSDFSKYSEDLLGCCVKIDLSDQEKAFFLLKLENTENEI